MINVLTLLKKCPDWDMKFFKNALIIFFFVIFYRLDTKMILQRTPEQMIWGYHEPLLEAAALLDDSLTFTSFGFFTKVMKLEMRCKFEFSFLGGNILHFGDFAV